MRCRHVIITGLAAIAGAVGVGPISPASAAGPPAFLTGTGDWAAPHVKEFDGAGTEVGGFYGFSPIITTGVRVASGDVDGDLAPEVITATGPGSTSLVVVHELNGAVIGSFSPYGAFTGGANVASGDVDGDTKDEIITAADAGGAPHVIVWDFDNGVATQKMGWYAYETNFAGGVSVAAADVIGSAKADIVTGEGSGGSSRVRVWDLGSGGPVPAVEFLAYGPTFRGGVRVAAGELNLQRVVVTGAGPGGGPHVRIWSPTGAEKASFFAYAPGFGGGVNVAVTAGQGADPGMVLTAPAGNGGPHVRGFGPSGTPLSLSYFAYAPGMTNGVTLAAIPTMGTQNNTNQNGSTNSSVG